MAGNQRIGNACQTSCLNMDVSAANFRKLNVQKSRVPFKIGNSDFANLDRRVRCWDDRGKRHWRLLSTAHAEIEHNRQSAIGNWQCIILPKAVPACQNGRSWSSYDRSVSVSLVAQ